MTSLDSKEEVKEEPKARKNFPIVVKLNPYQEGNTSASVGIEKSKSVKKVRFQESPSEEVVFGQIESIVLPGCADKEHPTEHDLKELQIDSENP